MSDHPSHSRWARSVCPPLPQTCKHCLTRVAGGRCRCGSSPLLPPPPVVYVTNWASVRAEGFAGPALRRLTIAAPRTRHGHGVGSVETMIPSFELEEDMRIDRDEWANHSARYADELWSNSREGETLRPGRLLFRRGKRPQLAEDDGRGFAAVRSGDTLCCTCGRGRAAKGECHRVVVAFALLAHGWQIILDGAELARRFAPSPTLDSGDLRPVV